LAIKYWCCLWDLDQIVAGFPIEHDNDAAAVLAAFRAMEELGCTAADLSDEKGRRVFTMSKNNGGTARKHSSDQSQHIMGA
jgi:hypothetical protein